MARGRRSNGEGELVSVLNYRFKGLELEDGTLTVDGIDPGEIRIQLDDEVPPDPVPKPGKVVDKIVECELRLLKVFDTEESGADRTVRGVSFRLHCANPAFTLRGTDIELMRKAMWDFLDESFKVKWEPYLLISIVPETLYKGISNGFCFGYERIERGVAHDGTLLMRVWGRGNRGGYEVREWPGVFKDRDGRLQACVPETDANEKALKEFIEMISQLRERLAAFFRPDTILQTLANLGSLQMLGADPHSETTPP